MSAEVPAYNPCYIKAWTLLSIVLAVILFTMFANCDRLLRFFQPLWDLIRWIFSPVI